MKPKTAGRVGDVCRQAGQLTCPDTPNVGLVSGAYMLTLNGERPVETLRVGDCVITRDHGPVPVTHIDVISMVTPLVYIIAGSIGHNRGDRDAMVSADQTIMLRDWRAQALFGRQNALTRARALVDGEFVRNLGQHAVTLYRIYCATPQVFFAEGLELGTPDTGFTHTLQRVA